MDVNMRVCGRIIYAQGIAMTAAWMTRDGIRLPIVIISGIFILVGSLFISWGEGK